MNMPKNLTSIVAGCALALSAPSCAPTSCYDYNDTIKNEQVKYNKPVWHPFIKSKSQYFGLPKDNDVRGEALTIKKENGNVIQYIDQDGDNRIDVIRGLDERGDIIKYDSKACWPILFKEGQQKWETYKNCIKDIKEKKGLELIK